MKTTGMALIVGTALLMASVGFGTACHREGPGERAGESIDDAAQKLKDKVDPPGPGEKAGRKVDKALGND
jgi:hypothetical protein